MRKIAKKPSATVGRPAQVGARGKAGVTEVTSTEFAGRFGHWSIKAQREPIGVVNNKTGTTVGYFVSEEEFAQYLELRQALPKARWAWEMSADLETELKKPLPKSYRD